MKYAKNGTTAIMMALAILLGVCAVYFFVTPPPVYTFPAETTFLRIAHRRYVNVIEEKEPGIFVVVEELPNIPFFLESIDRLESGELRITTVRNRFAPVAPLAMGAVLAALGIALAKTGAK